MPFFFPWKFANQEPETGRRTFSGAFLAVAVAVRKVLVSLFFFLLVWCGKGERARLSKAEDNRTDVDKRAPCASAQDKENPQFSISTTSDVPDDGSRNDMP